MGKKWYNFFVVTEESADASPDAKPISRTPPVPVPKRVVDVVPDAEKETEFAAPVANPTSLDEIYRSARITTPPHGYNVLKVADMLQSEHIRALPADVKQKSILVALDAAGVKVQEIVEDAVQRDRALDTYERVLQKHLETLRTDKERENRRLEEEINQKLAQLRATIAQNNQELSREEENLLAWSEKKREEENRIAEAVGYFVSENPVTTVNAPTKPKGGADHVR